MAFIEEILRKLGWDDGFQMPVANAENQALEQELARLTLHKTKAKTALDNTATRLSNLKEHFKFVSQECEQTQKLITAYKQQYDTENDQYHSIKGENSKFGHDINEVNKRIKFLEERKEMQRKDLEKAIVKVDKIKQETGWDIEALKAWEEALKQRDENNELIKKFSKEDERKFNELDARRLFLQSEFDTKNAITHKLVCELASCEMIIERTGKAIKQQINEREALIKQWKDSVKMLQQRDEDIAAEQEQISENQKVLAKQQEYLEEENAMLEREKRNNHETELETEKLNALNSRLRRDLAELQQNLILMASECHTIRRQVASTANSLEKLRIKSRQLDSELDQKEQKCLKDKEDMDHILSKIAEMKGTSNSAAARIGKIQKMIESEECHCTVLISDTEKINSNLYRSDQVLKEQQVIGKHLEIQINNVYCISNKLRKHMRDEKKQLEKLKEVVYDMQYRIDEFEQRLCKLEGSNKPEDHTDEKEEKIRDLEKILAEYTEVQHSLQNQVDRLQDEMRKLSNFIAADKEQLEILQNKVENHLLVYDIGKKQIAAAKKTTQEKQVEENIMRLRIDHIQKDMEKEKNKIFSLQMLRLTLDQAMKERNLEIDTKKTIVIAKKRNLQEEKGRLKSDITLRKIKLEQLQKKYHIELMALGKDDDGQPLSVTHFKIKNAQEKFILQQEGDELDQKIKVAETEIVAIENTLKVVNLTNAAFKTNLSPLKDDDLTIQEMKALEKLYKEWTQKCRKAKLELTEKEAAVAALNKLLNDDVKLTKTNMRRLVQELEEENMFIGKQENDKKERVKRTEAQLRKVLRSLRSADLTVYDQDLEVRQLRDANHVVMKKITSMMDEGTEMTPNINKYLQEYRIHLQSEVSLASSTFSTVSTISSLSTNRSVGSNISQITVKKIDITFK